MPDLDKIRALLAGAGQGATANFQDEGYGQLLSHLPMPDDGTGIPREYAAGSAAKDYTNNMRADNADLERRFPTNFHGGQMLGAAPGTIAGGAAIPAGSGLAMAGLAGGARGALAGAGAASEGNRLEGAARGAGPGALMGMAAEGAPLAFAKAKDFLGKMPPPGDGMVPAMAGAGSSELKAAGDDLAKPAVNMSAGATNPGRRLRGRAPTPVEEAPLEPPTGRWKRPDNDEELLAQGRADWEKDYPEAASQTENLHSTNRKAMLPGAGDDVTEVVGRGDEGLDFTGGSGSDQVRGNFPALGKAPPGKNPVNEHIDFLGDAEKRSHNHAQLKALQIDKSIADQEAGIIPRERNINDPSQATISEYPARKYPVYRMMDQHMAEMKHDNFTPEMPAKFPSTVSNTIADAPRTSQLKTAKDMFGEFEPDKDTM